MQELIALLLPPLIDTINSNVPNSRARFWISVVVCSLVGIVMYWANQPEKWLAEDVARQIMYVFGIAQLSYKAIWEQSEVRKSLGLKA